MIGYRAFTAAEKTHRLFLCLLRAATATVTVTRGGALPQTPLLALIRRESNVLSFLVTAVLNSGSTAVVVATAVLAAIVAAVLIAVLIAAVSGSTNSCAQW